ncbi:glycosyl hydrolase family 8 [Acuticoccus sediminis]|nr:glycosyl hydrolase family 8 [Acuticoccus sediminis]
MSRSTLWTMVLLVALSGAETAPVRAQDLYQGPIASEMSPEFYAWYQHQAAGFFQSYMAPEGRIFDPENGGISHSESQAYGMAIALAANAPELFDTIWGWTRRTLRNADGLHAWRYVPGQGVVDRNNATDADLIIAATLSVAARRWNRGDYLGDAARTADSLGRSVLVRHKGHVVMLPGKVGFMPPSQPDGPVINLSYYHFDIMQIVADLAPGYPWKEAIADGWGFYRYVIEAWTPSDWTSVADPEHPVPARNFPVKASYDAVRGPVNMLAVPWASNRDYVDIIDNRLKMNGGMPGIYDPKRGERVGDLTGSGYRLIAAAVDCVADGNPIPADLLNVTPETYFGSALHLMVIHQLYVKHPECIRF